MDLTPKPSILPLGSHLAMRRVAFSYLNVRQVGVVRMGRGRGHLLSTAERGRDVSTSVPPSGVSLNFRCNYQLPPRPNRRVGQGRRQDRDRRDVVVAHCVPPPVARPHAVLRRLRLVQGVDHEGDKDGERIVIMGEDIDGKTDDLQDILVRTGERLSRIGGWRTGPSPRSCWRRCRRRTTRRDLRLSGTVY